jgi:hypothetical protein
MNNFEPKPGLAWEERLERWLGISSIVLSHIGCWLLVAGMIGGLWLNRAILGWTLCSLGWFMGGLGGSFFAKTYLVTARKTEIANDKPESQYWLWPELRFGFFMILAIIAAPLLAPIAIGFTFLFDLILIIAIFVFVLIRIRKSLGFGSAKLVEQWQESTGTSNFS